MIAEFYYPLKKEQLLERPSDNRFWVIIKKYKFLFN